jgi:hypothetical protein
MPIFTSHCPGWVCYVEKSVPQAVPYLSTVKSAQQIVGSVIKSILTSSSSQQQYHDKSVQDCINFLNQLTLQNISLDDQKTHSNAVISESNGKKQQRVYVVSIQPCPDKKLEASRKDFYHSETGIQEVDLVLSTTELWQLLEGFAWEWNLERQREQWMDCESSDQPLPIPPVHQPVPHLPLTLGQLPSYSASSHTIECPHPHIPFQTQPPLTPVHHHSTTASHHHHSSGGTPTHAHGNSNNSILHHNSHSASNQNMSLSIPTIIPGAGPMNDDIEGFLNDGDEDDHFSHKRSRSSTTESQSHQTKSLIRSSFQHVFDYLDSLEPDSPYGSDSIERMFRCFTENGLECLAATEINNGSGGYAEYIFKYASEKLFGYDIWNLHFLPYKEGRNPDIAEVDLQTLVNNYPDEEIKKLQNVVPQFNVAMTNLKIGKAYGFRNIQTILNKMKKGQYDLDLIEMMACPSGCHNGGGQLKSLSSILPLSSKASENPIAPRPETSLESHERINLVKKVYHEHLKFSHPEENPLVQYLYTSNRLQHPLSEAALITLHTRYHAVPNLETLAPLAAKW